MPSRYVPMKEHIAAGRGRMVIKVNIDVEAYALLQSWAPSKKSYGEYISRMVYEERTRREEREKLREKLEEVLNQN